MAGYDLCTGWGTPAGGNLLYALGFPEPRVSPAVQALFTGPVGGPFAPASFNFTLTNQAGGNLDWMLADLPAWLEVSPTNGSLVTGGAAATITLSLDTSATNLAAGAYSATLWFTNLNDFFVQGRQVTLAIVTPPVILTQPADQEVFEGATAQFSVETASNALLFFQWQVNNTNLTDGSNILGSATSTLTLGDVSFADAGTYSVIVSNAAGVTVSSNALLTVLPVPPFVTEQPTNQIVLAGTPATFTVAAAGTQPLNYQWQFNGTNLTDGGQISGSQTSLLTISNALANDAGEYSVVVTNVAGATNSLAATLTVLTATPVITWTNPVAVNYGTALGSNQLNATANVSGAFAYNPAAGTILSEGTNPLTVVFTPDDTTDYYSATNSVSQVVLPVSLTITADNASRIFGATNPIFTGTITGLQNGDSITASFSCAATTASPLGTYPIIPGAVDPDNQLGNYNLILNNGLLTVAVPPPLISNGGFETGDFTGWSQSGSTQNVSVVTSPVHTGTFAAQLGPAGAPGYLSQMVATTPAADYRLSFWLDCTNGTGSNEFWVSWNTNTIFDQSNLPAGGWTNLQFLVVASDTNSIVAFGFSDDAGFLGLDDVSLEPLPTFESARLFHPAGNPNILFRWNAVPGLQYQIQYTADLSSPDWLDAGAAISATNNFVNLAESPTNAQRFYRVLLVP